MTGLPTDENDLRRALRALTGDEPPLGLGFEDAVRHGRRLRRRRRVTHVALPAAALAAVAGLGAAALVVAPGSSSQPEVVSVAAALPLSDAGRDAIADGGAAVTTAHGRTMLEAIRSVTPKGWVVDVDESDIGVPTVSGTVDDGRGKAQVMLSVTNTAGMFTVHPCQDPEYRAGASCTETTLADGSYLSVRGVADFKGIKTVIVNITRDDGTGVSVEAGNFDLPPQPAPGALVSADDKHGRYGPIITRDLPVYDRSALVTMVQRVAAVSGDWPTEPMKG